MRTAKVPKEIIFQKVWESLCKRMDPETHLVRPSWLTMMREIGVCRQHISTATRHLMAQGRIRSVNVPCTNGECVDTYYEILDPSKPSKS